MNITDYKAIKDQGGDNVVVSLINGTPALTIKKYNPDTGELLNNTDQVGIDVAALKLRVADMLIQIDNINELISDAEALSK